MRTAVAQILRRIARRLIKWSRRIAPPVTWSPFQADGSLDRDRLQAEGFVFVGAMVED